MLHRILHDPALPADADLDTDEMAATAACVERDERRVRVLERLTEIGMRLAEVVARKVEAKLEAAAPDDEALQPGKDPTLAFSRISQTVRRTVALEAKLAEGVRMRRDSLLAQRSTLRAEHDASHKAAKSKVILDGVHDAFMGSTSEAEYEDLIERLMEDAEEHLGDADEMRGWLDRPVGETVAKLCSTLGLDPDACTFDGETWKVRRPPTEFEHLLEERVRKYPPPPLPPSPLWGGTDGEAVRVGNPDATTSLAGFIDTSPP